MKIKLLVAGEFYTNSKPYYDIISQKNLAESVVMTGDFIPDSDVAKYFNACDIVVQPYKDATQSGVTQIGYHFNKPMLVTNVGGLPEIIPHMQVGYVVDPNPDEISKALIDFFENNRLEDFTNNILKEKERFSWDKMTHSIMTLASQIKKKK